MPDIYTCILLLYYILKLTEKVKLVLEFLAEDVRRHYFVYIYILWRYEWKNFDNN